MTIADLRETYDDIIVTDSREVVDAEEFERATNSEAATVGWVVLGFVFDDAGRVLLIDQSWADGWIMPGGVRKPGEALSETVTREIREETGVEITPVRPHALEEYTFENGRTDETDGWTTVYYEATADTTEITNDPGLDDEEIEDVAWFERPPSGGFEHELSERVYQRCRGEDVAR